MAKVYKIIFTSGGPIYMLRVSELFDPWAKAYAQKISSLMIIRKEIE
jgi:hypothetical protein